MITLNGTIIIIDPCNLSLEDDWGNMFDWHNMKIENDIFTNYSWENTGYGDGSWYIYDVDYISIENIKRNIQEGKGIGNNLPRPNTIGSFSVDSGTYCILYLDEALKYNPKFLDNLGKWNYTIIPDFNGYIESFRDYSYGTFHIIGIGNKSFYSN